MRYDITQDFTGAAEKGLKVFFNETSGEYEILCGYTIKNGTPDYEEKICYYDSLNDAGDASDGEAAKKVQEFIEAY